MQAIELTTQITSDGQIQLPHHYQNCYGRIVKLIVLFQDSAEAVSRERSLATKLLEIGRQCAASPLLDKRLPEEILGYDNYGVPS